MATAITLATVLHCLAAGCSQTNTNAPVDQSLHDIIMYPGGNRIGRAKALIRSGADLNEYRGGVTPAMRAVGWGGQYDLATAIIRAGARIDLLQHDSPRRLAHHVETDRRKRSISWTPQQKTNFLTLVAELENRGEIFSNVKNDVDRWEHPNKAASGQTPGSQEFEAKATHALFQAVEEYAKRQAATTARTDHRGGPTEDAHILSPPRNQHAALQSHFGQNPVLAFLNATSTRDKPTGKLHQFIRDSQSDSLLELQAIIDQGASVNHLLLTGETPAMLAVQRRKFAVAAALVRAGADLSLPKWDRKTGQITRLKLIHYVDRYSEVIEQYPPEQQQAYAELVEELAKRGERLEDVKDERHFWDQPLGD